MKHRSYKINIRKLSIMLSLIVLVSLNACTTQFLASDAISVIATDKTLGDHVVSLISKKDCSTVRQELGLSYCKEDDLSRIQGPKTYCYRELGKVTCYKQAEAGGARGEVEDKAERIPTR